MTRVRVPIASAQQTTMSQPPSSASSTTPETVDLLILGAGWTSTFLIPLLESARSSNNPGLTWRATSTTGRAGTLKFQYDPSSATEETFRSLPEARFVLIVFPLRGEAQTRQVLELYASVHRSTPRWIQLGSTGIWQPGSSAASAAPEAETRTSCWVDRHSGYDQANLRAQAEDELLRLRGCVLNLAGLWGGKRDPRHWIEKVGGSKEKVAEKKSLHMVHGLDVARGILGVLEAWDRDGGESLAGERYMLTDGFVYDWWSLFTRWAEFGSRSEEDGGQEPSLQARWVADLMRESGIKALPRSMEALGRCYDSREFWTLVGVVPVKAGLENP